MYSALFTLIYVYASGMQAYIGLSQQAQEANTAIYSYVLLQMYV